MPQGLVYAGYAGLGGLLHVGWFVWIGAEVGAEGDRGEGARSWPRAGISPPTAAWAALRRQSNPCPSGGSRGGSPPAKTVQTVGILAIEVQSVKVLECNIFCEQPALFG